MGLKLAASGQLSPLTVIEKELSQLGFASTVVEIDSAVFLSVTRRRFSLLCVACCPLPSLAPRNGLSVNWAVSDVQM